MASTRNLHKIIVGELPPEGKQFAGVLEEDIFALPAGDPQCDGPIRYDLNVSHHDGLILATGSLQTSFSLGCVRCLRQFPYRVELRGHCIEVELDGAGTVDLTEPIREDILLALPAYPRCQDSSLGSLVCDPGVKVYSSEDPPPAADATKDADGASKQNVWGALDNLESLNDND